MSATELMLIDLSGIAHQIWHVDTNNPDPSRVSTQTIARVRALASQHPHAAVCCDSGKSFRADIDPQYKANRDTANRAPLRHQMDLACEVLAKDGFPVWRVPGFEADDIIATATAQALAIEETTVLIVSSDKDLTQLVSDRVRMKKITEAGEIVGPAEVFDKFGVRPDQMADYLALVGDKSDNIVGAKGIGGVIAGRLLSEHGTLKALFEKFAHGMVAGVTPVMRTNLQEFRSRWPTVARLIELKSDVPIPFAEIASEREAKAMDIEEAKDMMNDNEQALSDVVSDAPLGLELDQNESLAALGEATAKVAERIKNADTNASDPRTPRRNADGSLTLGPAQTQTITLASPATYAPVDFSQQLEPRSMPEAKQLAQMMFESRLFGAYGTPQAVLATVLAGRELGIPAMASLRAFHVIEGKPTMSAGTIQSLVLKSGKAKYFRCAERTTERATFVTKRGDDPEMALTYTIEEAKQAWPKDAAAFAKSGWGRNPADMLVARASSKLARLVYPDVVSGLYAPEEME